VSSLSEAVLASLCWYL